MKIHFGILVILWLLIIPLSPYAIHAQGSLEMAITTAKVKFPTELIFNLSARSVDPIADIRLRYTTDRFSFTKVINEAYVEFEPASSANVSWTLDMQRTGGLPPGTMVTYWWLLTDTRGNKYQTDNEKVLFDDLRYTWQKLNESPLTLYWYKGNASFAQGLMDTAQQALKKLCADAGIQLVKPIRLYVYASAQDVRGAIIYPIGWEAGVAFTDYGAVILSVAPDELVWGKKIIAHELAHLVTRQLTVSPYNGIPTWLSEGISVNAEGALSSARTSRLSKAVKNEQLISARSLTSPFLVDSDAASLSYAESGSIVEYLVRTHGQSKLLQLLDTFKQGSTYDEALQKIYNFNIDALNNLWQSYAKTKYK